MKFKNLLAAAAATLLLSCLTSAAQPKVPDYIVFAGDTVRFDRADLRERMDRELIAFCYSHTNSTLMIKRANRYFPQIEPLLKAAAVPDDLKYLMVMESNVDPKAVSSAGAAGFWQFMKETGKSFGLVVNTEVDERYNTEKATLAACRYLKQAYAKYHDWLTAAASYNAGQGNISKRLTDQHQKSAMDLWLVEETSRYMFRILTAKLVFSDPRRYGFVLRSEDLYPYIPPKDTVTVTTPITDLAAFARQHGVSFAQLKADNLWLRENSLNNKSGRTYSLKIPDGKALYYNPKETKVHDRRWVIDK